MKNLRLTGALTVLALAAVATRAQEWTQWRGPARDGSVSGKNVPAVWPKSLKRSWHVEIGEGYSSPVVADSSVFVHGRRDPEEIVAAINLADGKVIWQQKYQAAFKKNQYAVEMAKGPNSTPQGTHAYTLKQTGGKWEATETWKNPDIAMYMSSPVFGDGLIYGHSSKKKGQFFAVDEKTGAVRWTTEGREGEHASLLLTPQHVVFLTNNPDLIVAERGTPAFALERRYDDVAQASTFAMPVLLGSNILVRDATGLMLLTAGN
jgi:outer membrane protein assembly factor BamB